MRINEYILVTGKYFDKGLKEDQYYPVALRRPRLTLRHLNKLRKAREISRLEQQKHDALVSTMYKVPDESENKRGRDKK